MGKAVEGTSFERVQHYHSNDINLFEDGAIVSLHKSHGLLKPCYFNAKKSNEFQQQ